MDRTEYIDHLSERGRDSSEIASTVCRNIGFAAGIACWAFRDNNFTFPSIILLALVCLCIFFLLDISQYAMAWHVTRQLARSVTPDPDRPAALGSEPGAKGRCPRPAAGTVSLSGQSLGRQKPPTTVGGNRLKQPQELRIVRLYPDYWEKSC